MEEVPLSREAAAARGEVASASRPCVVLAAPGAPGEHVPKAGEGERECRLVRGDEVDLGAALAASKTCLVCGTYPADVGVNIKGSRVRKRWIA